MRDPYAKSTPSECWVIESLQGILKASQWCQYSLQWPMHMSTGSMSTELENTDSKYLLEHNKPEIHY